MQFETDSALFRFVCKKLTFDLAKEAQREKGSNAENLLIAISSAVEAASHASSFASVYARRSKRTEISILFDEALKGISREGKKRCEDRAKVLLDFMFGVDDEGFASTERENDAVVSSIVGPNIEDEEKEEKDKGIGEKGKKRSREAKKKEEEEGEEVEGRGYGKRKKKSPEKRKEPEKENESDIENDRRRLEIAVSLIPEDVWVEIFQLLPDSKYLVIARTVNTDWLEWINVLIFRRFPAILTRYNPFFKSFSNFPLLSLDLSYNDEIDNDALSGFKSLTYLDLTENDQITHKGLENLTNLQTLRAMKVFDERAMGAIANVIELDLRHSVFAGKNFEKCTNLMTLWMGRNRVREKTRYPSSLKRFQFEGHETKDFSAGTHINFLKLLPDGLEELRLSGVILPSRARRVAKFEKLKVLSANAGTNLDNKTISNLTNLTDLDLRKMDKAGEAGGGQVGPRITDEAFENLTNLTSLGVYKKSGVRGSGFKNLVNLTKLNAREIGFSDEDSLRPLTNLTDLRLAYSSGIVGKCFEFMPHLTSLDVRKTGIEIENLLLVAPRLKRLVLNLEEMTPDLASSLKELTYLSVKTELGVSEYDWGSEIFAHLEGLKTLKFVREGGHVVDWNADFGSDAIFEKLSNLTALTVRSSYAFEGFCLAKMRDLRSPEVVDCAMASADRLILCTNLTRLKMKRMKNPNVFWSYKDDRNFDYFPIEKLVNLRELRLTNLPTRNRLKAEKASLAIKLLNLDGISKSLLLK